MIIDGTLKHQHEDSQGMIFGAPHLITAKHNKISTIKFHNITIMQDGLNNTYNYRRIGLKSIPIQNKGGV